jgi:SAM-dependent methyltransferase
MGNECSKAVVRRLYHPSYVTKYFVGNGIDIGSGTDALGNSDGLGQYRQQFPLMLSCRGWDIEDGDAQYLASIADESFDFVHSSHCLEHMHDPFVALSNWFRILKPYGHLVVTVPDEDLYEQGARVENGRFYSDYNGDHKCTLTIYKPPSSSWSPQSINVIDLMASLGSRAKPIKVELLDNTYQYDMIRHDQTGGIAECAIEFVVRKVC